MRLNSSKSPCRMASTYCAAARRVSSGRRRGPRRRARAAPRRKSARSRARGRTPRRTRCGRRWPGGGRAREATSLAGPSVSFPAARRRRARAAHAAHSAAVRARLDQPVVLRHLRGRQRLLIGRARRRPRVLVVQRIRHRVRPAQRRRQQAIERQPVAAEQRRHGRGEGPILATAPPCARAVRRACGSLRSKFALQRCLMLCTARAAALCAQCGGVRARWACPGGRGGTRPAPLVPTGAHAASRAAHCVRSRAMADPEDDGAAQLLVAFSAAPPPAAGACGAGGGALGGGRLRCLDPSHDAACGRCAPRAAAPRAARRRRRATPLRPRARGSERRDRRARADAALPPLPRASCAAAPPLGDEQQYELVGDPGRKNGAAAAAPGTRGERCGELR